MRSNNADVRCLNSVVAGLDFALAAKKQDASSSKVFRGDATYTIFGLGACEKNNHEPQLVAAINRAQFGSARRSRDSEWCGKCARVSAPKFKTSVVVEIVDRASGNEGHLVLSQAAFKKLASLDEGRIDINWNVVPCPKGG